MEIIRLGSNLKETWFELLRGTVGFVDKTGPSDSVAISRLMAGTPVAVAERMLNITRRVWVQVNRDTRLKGKVERVDYTSKRILVSFVVPERAIYNIEGLMPCVCTTGTVTCNWFAYDGVEPAVEDLLTRDIEIESVIGSMQGYVLTTCSGKNTVIVKTERSVASGSRNCYEYTLEHLRLHIVPTHSWGLPFNQPLAGTYQTVCLTYEAETKKVQIRLYRDGVKPSQMQVIGTYPIDCETVPPILRPTEQWMPFRR